MNYPSKHQGYAPTANLRIRKFIDEEVLQQLWQSMYECNEDVWCDVEIVYEPPQPISDKDNDDG